MDTNKRTGRYLVASVLAVAVLCVGVFFGVIQYIRSASGATLTRVGEIYMQEISHQVRLHFRTVVNLRLSQIQGVIWRTPPETARQDAAAARDRLVRSGQAIGFSTLALYSTAGGLDTLYGEPLTIEDADAFLAAMNRADPRITIGSDAAGQEYLVLGVSVGYPEGVGYPLNIEGECTALVAALPLATLNETLELEQGGSLVFSHIMRRNGDLVLVNTDLDTDNYYDWLCTGCTFDTGTGAEAAEALRQAVETGQDYSTVMRVEGVRRHIYCTALPDSDWTLITVMPYGPLDEIVSGLGERRTVVTLGGCALLLAALGIAFFGYWKLSGRQMQALRQAQAEAQRANQAKSEFLSNMSHDIRTPLNAIVGMTGIAAANLDDPDRVQDCLRKIHLSSRHLLGLINDVLDMSKIESGRLTLNIAPVSLRETMEALVSIVQPLVKAKRQNFDVVIRDITAERVLCDDVRLNQVLLNLLSNAVKFTPEAGRITVTLYQQPSPAGADRVCCHFLVQDTGIGMSEEFQRHIFDSFAREDNARVQKIEGTGLGMAITKYIVDAMQGKIQVDSRQGEGSTFHVTLDLACAGGEETDLQLPPWRVLVVDDNEDLRQSALQELDSLGVRAQAADSGPAAIEMAVARAAEGQGYQAVLLDWKMPGMDGIETARRLRDALGDQLPLLLVSAYDGSEIESEARAAGIRGFLGKPLFRSTLYHGLRRCLAADEPAPESREPEPSTLEGRRLLVAEDNEINWEIAAELLGDLGFLVEHAEDGCRCVELFEASAPGYYDAILMDLRMPRMNGYEATRAIRASTRPDHGLPIIAMTADAFSEDVQKCLDCGMNAHVAKPLDLRELVRLLQKFIGAAD